MAPHRHRLGRPRRHRRRPRRLHCTMAIRHTHCTNDDAVTWPPADKPRRDPLADQRFTLVYETPILQAGPEEAGAGALVKNPRPRLSGPPPRPGTSPPTSPNGSCPHGAVHRPTALPQLDGGTAPAHRCACAHPPGYAEAVVSWPSCRCQGLDNPTPPTHPH